MGRKKEPAVTPVVTTLTPMQLEVQKRIDARLSSSTERLLANDALLNAYADVAIKGKTLEQLRNSITDCSNIIVSMPSMSKRTREMRKWSGRTTYGYGAEFELLSQLMTGIQYSASEHRIGMLATTHLNEAIVSEFTEALGQLPYYNVNYNVIVPGQLPNIDKLINLVQVIGVELGMHFDTSKLTQANAEAFHAAAHARAIKEQTEFETTASTEGQRFSVA